MSDVLINPDEYEIEDYLSKTPLFAFDLDSVLSNTEYLHEGICKKFGVGRFDLDEGRSTEGYQRFQFQIPGVSNNKMYAAIHEIVHDEGPSALPNPFTHDVLSYYHKLTRDPIVVVTARHRDNAQITYNWLKLWLHDIPFHAIVCHGVPKTNVLINVGCDYFVDDRYKTIDNLQGHIMHPVIYTQPWNQGRERQASQLRVRDLRDLIPIFNIETGLPPAYWPGNIPYPNRAGYTYLEEAPIYA